MGTKKDVWKFVIQTVIAILTAIGTTLGVTSCMAYEPHPYILPSIYREGQGGGSPTLGVTSCMA